MTKYRKDGIIPVSDQLSDQLKMIYLEERRRLMNAGRPGAWNTGKTR